MNNAQKNNNLEVKGTSQKERRSYALMPENLRIDPREIQDLLNYVHAVALNVRFVGEDSRSNTPWAAYFEKAPVFLVSAILKNKPDEWSERMRKAIWQFYNTGQESRQAAVADAIQIVAEMFHLLNAWYERSVDLLKWKEQTAVNKVLAQAIQADLRPAVKHFRGVLGALEKANIVSGNTGVFDMLDGLHPLWEAGEALPDSGVAGESERDKQYLMAIEQLRQLFQRLLYVMSLVEKKANHWLADSLEHQNDHEPHVGLVLTFLKLFLHARDQLNAKPVEHLNYYYLDILKQQLKNHTPDRTVVCFQLADHVNALLLEPGTRLLADINEAGVASTYATVQPLYLTQTRIAALRTLHMAKNTMMKSGSSYKLVSGVYVAPVANSADGLGAPFLGRDATWPVFGEEQLDKLPNERQMIDGTVGFVIASPVLWLREGERTVTLRLEFAPASLMRFFDLLEDMAGNTGKPAGDIALKMFEDSLLVDVSTEKGWFRAGKWQVDTLADWKNNQGITLSIFLSLDDPALTDYDPLLTGEDYGTNLPLLRVRLNPDTDIYMYSFLSSLELELVKIDTAVTGLKTLNLSSDIGPVDISAPFMPFGPIPVKNGSLMLGNAELFRKRLTDLKIHIEWNRMPEIEGGFQEYYKEYGQNTNNHSFKVKLSALSRFSFRPEDSSLQQLVNLFSAPGVDSPVSTFTVIENIDLDSLRLHPDYSLKELEPFSNVSRTGYLKLQLAEPAGAFGHSDYHRLFTSYMLAQARAGKNQAETYLPPREPFVPVINRISVAYQASSVMNLRPLESQENDPAANEKIIAVYPFGRQDIFAGGKGLGHTLFPRFDEDGYLYIGLLDAQPDKPITLYFQLRESKIKLRSWGMTVSYSYLLSDQWEPVKQEHLLSDTTRRFTTSGIITMQLPERIDTEHTIMPSGMYWIRVAAKGNLEPVGRVISVHTHAVEAVWEDNGDETHFDEDRQLPLIQGLLVQRAEIAAVVQPGPFYGGAPRETMEQLYVRTSERLRHKNRGISSWDIECLVLQQFPFIRRAKCITPLESDRILPGTITLVVIQQAPETELTPRLGYHNLAMIQQFLQGKLSTFVDIQVVNPVYEKVKVSCSILLEKGLEHEKGRYLQILHEDLLDFICPWLKAGPVIMGNAISKNELLSFIKGRPYIRFVSGFSMLHIFEQEEDEFALADTAVASQGLDVVQASTLWSVLIPMELHQIEFIDHEEYVLPDVTAINEMRLGMDFVIVSDEPESKTAVSEEQTVTDHPEFDESAESYLIPLQA